MAFLIVGFTLLNSDIVNFDYYFNTLRLPLALLLAAALIVGVLMGISACMFRLIGSRRQVRQLKNKLELQQQEINNLRKIPIKDEH